MITVIFLFQHFSHLARGTVIFQSHTGYLLREIAFQLFLGNAAECLVTGIHTDVLGLVETAEHAYLGEFRHSRQQYELQVAVRSLEDRIETLQHIPVAVLQLRIRIQYIQNRLVVLINEHYRPTACLLVGGTEYITEEGITET